MHYLTHCASGAPTRSSPSGNRKCHCNTMTARSLSRREAQGACQHNLKANSLTFELMRWFQNSRFIFSVYCLLAIAVSAQKYALGTSESEEKPFRHYNNYAIFKSSAKHLLEGKNLYVAYPEEHDDLYKYSPTFAAFMLLFSLMPDAVGLCAWNLLNAIPLFLAVWLLPLSEKKRALIAWLILPELLISMQNAQSNGLMAACIMLAFVAIERNKAELAFLPISISVFIKLFGAVGGVLAVFGKNRLRVALFGAVWSLALLTLPLLFVPIDDLLWQYENWFNLLKEDYGPIGGASVHSIWATWLKTEPPKAWLTALGVVALLAPLAQIKKYENLTFRATYLGFLMIWAVIFNHRAESPTFIIAICGAMIWFLAQENQEKNALNLALLGVALFCASILPSDLVPKSWTDFGWKYELKAIGCTLVWFKALYDLFALKAEEINPRQTAEPVWQDARKAV